MAVLEKVKAKPLVAPSQAMPLDQILRGDCIAATSANMFIRLDDRWRTPSLHECGVSGVMRDWVITQNEVNIAPVAPAEVERAEAVFLCNAVRGILPVRQLGTCVWPQVHPEIRALQSRLSHAHPGFESPLEKKKKKEAAVAP